MKSIVLLPVCLTLLYGLLPPFGIASEGSSNATILARGTAKLDRTREVEVTIESGGAVTATLGERSHPLGLLERRTTQKVVHALAEIRRRAGSLENAKWETPSFCFDKEGERIPFPANTTPSVRVELPIGDNQDKLIPAAVFYPECHDPKRRESPVSYVEELASLTKSFVEIAELFLTRAEAAPIQRGEFLSTGVGPAADALTVSSDGAVMGSYYDWKKDSLVRDKLLTFQPGILDSLSEMASQVADTVVEENYHPKEAKVCFNLGRPIKVSALGKSGWVVVGELGCQPVVHTRRLEKEASVILSVVSSLESIGQ